MQPALLRWTFHYKAHTREAEYGKVSKDVPKKLYAGLTFNPLRSWNPIPRVTRTFFSFGVQSPR